MEAEHGFPPPQERILRGRVNRSWTFVCHRLSSKSSKYARSQNQDRNLQGTLEQIPDVPCAGDGRAVGEIAEDLEVFRLDRIKQCSVEQTDETPIFPSMRRSLRGLSLRSKERRNRL